MKRTSLLAGILVGALTSLPVIALTLLGAWLFNLAPVPLDIFDWLARTLPGQIIAFGINSMVAVIQATHLGPTASTAKLGEQIMGLLSLVFGGAVFGGLLALVGQRNPRQLPRYGLIGGTLLAIVTLLIEAALGFKTGFFSTVIWLLIIFLAWGAVLGRLLRGPAAAVNPSLVPDYIAEEPTPGEAVTPASYAPTLTRREFIYLGAAGLAAVVVSAVGLENLRNKGLPATGGLKPAPVPTPPGPIGGIPQATLAARIQPAPGTRSELTPTKDFYRIDIDTFPPALDASSWRLELGGLVDKPLSLSLNDIRSHNAVSQPLTMQCISNPLGGDLTGTTIWTGVPFKDILAEAGLKPDVAGVYMESKDGYFEFIHLKDAMDPRTLLVYEMDGEPLTEEHGFPLRIYIPNRYGMKQPKWITRMEAMNTTRIGYWVERGWDEDAFVQTTSVIDTVATNYIDKASHTIPVGGIAWAGSRGISKVEVQVDNGPWAPAQLRLPELSSLCWVQWRYDWPAQNGSHHFAVRAYDGDGVLQVVDPNPPDPKGATGIDSMDAIVVE